MPTYEYVCEKCGAEFELFQSMKDDPIKTCTKEVCPKPRWAKGRVKRQMGTGAGIIFKGSGFYQTDYRSEDYKAAAKKETESGKPKTETKKSDATPKASADSGKKSPKKE